MQLDTITAQTVFNAQQSERKKNAQQPFYDYETDTDVESNFPNNLLDSPVGVNTISVVNEPMKQTEFMVDDRSSSEIEKIDLNIQSVNIKFYDQSNCKCS